MTSFDAFANDSSARVPNIATNVVTSRGLTLKIIMLTLKLPKKKIAVIKL